MDWTVRRDHLKALAALKEACVREMDKAQQGKALGQDTLAAFSNYFTTRAAYLDARADDTPGTRPPSA